MSKKITELPAVSTATDSALLPVVQDGATSHITKANLLKEITTWMISINSLLASDNTSLDELQEIVNFITVNKSTLDALALEKTTGFKHIGDIQPDTTDWAVDDIWYDTSTEVTA